MNQKTLVAFSLALILLLAFLKLGQHPLSPWDESRNAINAIEMLQNGDWLNLHFCGQPDTWSFKPPLFIWCVALSFKLLGFNELALRLPSALAILTLFYFTFNIIALYRSATFAVLTCLLLASVKGLIGWHVGRTGDFDALLACLLVASVFHFLRFVDFGKKNGALLSGLCIGLAYLTKGPAAAVLLPGMLLYVIFTKKINPILKLKTTWSGAAIALAFPVGWAITQEFWGKKAYSTTTSDQLFTVDLLKRFTQPADGWKSAFDPSFFFYSLDKSFNLWHFVFFGFLAFGLVLLAKNRAQTWAKLLSERNRLLLLSACLYLPLALFLVMAAKSNRWYLAPTLPFVGIATFWGIRHFWQKRAWVKWAYIVLLAFTTGRQAVLFWQVPPKPDLATKFNPVFSQAETIIVANLMEQDLLVYLYFQGKKMRFGSMNLTPKLGEILVVEKSKIKDIPARIGIAGDDGKHYLLMAK